jgi:hypothetical protein
MFTTGSRLRTPNYAVRAMCAIPQHIRGRFDYMQYNEDFGLDPLFALIVQELIEEKHCIEKFTRRRRRRLNAVPAIHNPRLLSRHAQLSKGQASSS